MLMHANQRTTAMELVESRLGRPLREVLLSEYREMTAGEICRQLGISRSTLERWMAALGLERRSVIVAIEHDHDGTPGHDGQGENTHDGPDPHPLAGDDQRVGANGG